MKEWIQMEQIKINAEFITIDQVIQLRNTNWGMLEEVNLICSIRNARTSLPLKFIFIGAL